MMFSNTCTLYTISNGWCAIINVNKNPAGFFCYLHLHVCSYMHVHVHVSTKYSTCMYTSRMHCSYRDLTLLAVETNLFTILGKPTQQVFFQILYVQMYMYIYILYTMSLGILLLKGMYCMCI